MIISLGKNMSHIMPDFAIRHTGLDSTSGAMKSGGNIVIAVLADGDAALRAGKPLQALEQKGGIIAVRQYRWFFWVRGLPARRGCRARDHHL
jgi:hypothetical protein